MKIAIDISPLSSGHKIRGTGFYLQHLKDALSKYFPEHDYTFFQNGDLLPDKIDIVHYPYFDPFFLTLPFNKKYKTVVTVHDLTPIVFSEHFPAGLKGNIKWQFQKFNLQKVDGILTDSNASKKDIIKIVGFSEEKVDVAYLAAGEEFKKVEKRELRVESLRKEYNLPEKFVLYVGDVTWNKNLPRLLKAVQKVNVPLVMVGKSLSSKNFDHSNKWNSDLVEVQMLAEQNKNVHILGFVPTEDLVTLYNLATMFVFPSVYEGFGLPIVEAMQSGCPVIITREGCMPEVGGDAAFYFDGYDTDSLIDAISQVYHSEKLQKELAEKGLKQAEKFNWKKTAEETINAYRKAQT
jgi:glycosyltransferase involved in cell wall biosynthesis